PGPGVVEALLHGVGLHPGEAHGRRLEAEVDDSGAVVDHPLDAGHDVGHRGRSRGRHDLGHHQVGVGGDTGDPDAVAPHGGGDARDVGAVAVVVGAGAGATGRVTGGADARGGGHDLARQVLVGDVDAGVDD